MTDYRLSGVMRCYRRALVLLLPRRFRERFAHQMIAVFAELEAEARSTGGRGAAVVALLSELPGLVRLSARERNAERERITHLPNAEPRFRDVGVEDLQVRTRRHERLGQTLDQEESVQFRLGCFVHRGELYYTRDF
jgi:hypothetical protein